MVSVAGSVQKEDDIKAEEETPSGETPGGPTPSGNFLDGMKHMLGLAKKEEEDITPDPILEWQEFPWERYLIQEDIIKKWK